MKSLLFAPLFLTLLIGCATLKPQHSETERNPAVSEHYLQVDSDGAWCWFGDPRAVSDDEGTYISYLTKNGEVVVSKYFSATKTMKSVFFSGAPHSIDDHNNPSLIMLPDGNLMIFFSEHNGTMMYFSKTSRPRDISTFRGLRKIREQESTNMGFSYPNPVQIKEGGKDKLFLFWRGDDWTPTFAVSSNAGESWTKEKSLVKNGVQRPYVKYFGDSQNRIHMTMTDGHPSTIPTNSVYYMYYQNGAFFKANGDKIGTVRDLPFNLRQLDTVYVPGKPKLFGSIFGADGEPTGRAWVWSIAVDPAGRPLITFSASPESDEHNYYYARWNGSSWVKKFIAEGGGSIQKKNGHKREDYYSGGVFIDPTDTRNLYLSKQDGRKKHRVEQWRLTADGSEYEYKSTLSSPSKASFRPFVPLWRGTKGRQNSFRVLWMAGEYEYYTDYDTAIEGIVSEELF